MNDLRQILGDLASWILLPASVFGAGGAIIRAVRKGKTLKQVAFEGAGGVVVANMVGPLIAAHLPEQWHYTLYFLVGWGGLEGVGRLYEAAVSALEQRIHGKINPDSQGEA